VHEKISKWIGDNAILSGLDRKHLPLFLSTRVGSHRLQTAYFTVSGRVQVPFDPMNWRTASEIPNCIGGSSPPFIGPDATSGPRDVQEPEELLPEADRFDDLDRVIKHVGGDEIGGGIGSRSSQAKACYEVGLSLLSGVVERWIRCTVSKFNGLHVVIRWDGEIGHGAFIASRFSMVAKLNISICGMNLRRSEVSTSTSPRSSKNVKAWSRSQAAKPL
jgi:hypothetical protein